MASKDREEVRRVAETFQMLMDHLKCPICLETLRNPVKTRCLHTFCQLCINQIIKDKNATCPLCNSRVNRRGLSESEMTKDIVQIVQTMIGKAKIDISARGYGDVFQHSMERRSSTKESFSPTEGDCSSNGVVAPESKRHSRVTSWLQQVGNSIARQESNASAPEGESTSNEDSDVEMVSVSQINPDQHSKDGPLFSSKKPLSAHIEEDVETAHGKSKTVTLKTKPSVKPLASKKVAPLKARQKHLKTSVSPCKAGSSTVTLEEVNSNVPDLVGDFGKENTTNSPSIPSPGWSRVRKMKKDFHQQSNILRNVKAKGKHSPVSAIEDPVSGDDEPCLNLSLSSPMLKKKAKMDEIVTGLETELEILEKSVTASKRKSVQISTITKAGLKSNFIDKSSRGNRETVKEAGVKFFKLGPVSPKRGPIVPIYLKGSLEHLHFIDGSNFSYRLLSDAQTQTVQEVGAQVDPSAAVSANPKSTTNFSPVRNFKSPLKRKSRGSDAYSEVDLMDVETVVLSQPVLPSQKSYQNADKNLPFDDEVLQTSPKSIEVSQKSISIICSQGEGEDCFIQSSVPEENKQSQLSTSLIISSQDVGKCPTQRTDFVVASHPTSVVDLDETTSSSTKPSKKRTQSESSDSDIGTSTKRIKNKKPVESDNEDSNDNEDLGITVGDTMEILANIEAQLEGDSQSQETLVHQKSTNLSQQKNQSNKSFNVHGNISTIEVDSDDDEVINPTPQKQPSFSLRSATQSDDIVPSSQPVAPDNKAPVSLFETGLNETSAQPSQNSIVHDVAVAIQGDQGLRDCAGKDLPNHVNLVETQTQEPTEPSNSAESLDVPVVPKTVSVNRPVFVCSSIPSNLVVQVEKLAHMVGGEFCSKFTSNSSHLIVRVDEHNRADKTLKYLCAVSAGKWVVSFTWVQKCLEAKKLIPEEPFEALDTSGEPGPRRSREAHIARKHLFGSFEFCCIGDFPDLSKPQLEALLTECGASVVSNPTDFSFRDHIVPVTLALWDESKEEEYSSWMNRYSAPLVQHEWVLDCIGKFNVTSFSPMLLCDAPDDVLASMGIPAYLYEYTDSEQ